jgi:acyl-coenzyme A thioesterase PaaI-like protein
MSDDDKSWGARLDAVRGELAVLAAEVRRLIAVTVSVDAPGAVLLRAAEEVRAVAAALEPLVPSPHPPRYPGGGSDPTAFFPFDPVVGPLNPLAPPLRLSWMDPIAVGVVTFGVPYEGPPGCVHGGILAATFDQVLNVANLMGGVAGPTRRLEVRYLKPTPLGAELRFEGWVESVAGREVRTLGRVLAGDVVTAEAEGHFVQIPLERVMRMLDERPAPDAATPEAGGSREPAPLAPGGAAPESSAARRRRFRSSGDGT